jgi:ferredoxin-NADP reductase
LARGSGWDKLTLDFAAGIDLPMPPPTYTTTVREIRDVAPDVRELTLAAPGTRLDWTPGQWISLHLPVGEKPPLVRAYTLATPPRETGELVLCLDRVPGGLGSDYLFSIGPGTQLTFGAPMGRFTLQETDADQIWVARFTGIVPFRAMVLALRERPPKGKVTLVYGAPRPEDLAYHAELLRTAEECPWFELLATVDEPDEHWAGHVGPELDLLPAQVGDRKDLLPMACGKREFVHAVRTFFQERGYDRRAVKIESYD